MLNTYERNDKFLYTKEYIKILTNVLLEPDNF